MKPIEAKHTTIFRDNNYFSAWPFSGGLYQYDDEIVAGFFRGKVDYSKKEQINHGYVLNKVVEYVLARSFDGGTTWAEKDLSVIGTVANDESELTDEIKAAKCCWESDKSYDSNGDGYLLFGQYLMPEGKKNEGKDGRAAVKISEDRGKTFNEMTMLPTWMPGARFNFVDVRPSYITMKSGMLLLFGAGSRDKKDEEYDCGVRPLVWASWNGGASWGLLSEVEIETPTSIWLLPFPLLLDNGEILMTVRRQYNGYNAFTHIYRSADEGRTWQFHSRPNDWGAPANLVQLPDGRVVCIYGYRMQGWGIRARVSSDNGATWGDEIIVRDGAGSWDVGYPRSVVKPDGSILTTYYFNREDDEIQNDGGVRHIEATIWKI
jgi:hypothetical protein